MAIVVRELVIRAHVAESGAPSGQKGTIQQGGHVHGQALEVERIVALCVEKVMENIANKKER